MTAHECWQIGRDDLQLLARLGEDLPVGAAGNPQIPEVGFHRRYHGTLGKKLAIWLQDDGVLW
jgi:hypothetical protein